MMKKDNKSHGVQLLLRCIVRDPDGKIITDTGRKPAKSFVIQFLEFLYYMFKYDANETATATDGTEDGFYYQIAEAYRDLRVDAGVSVATYGVVVGTGDTAETNADFALETQIAEGAGAGQLVHGSTTVGDPAVVGANVDLEVRRAFTNASGNTITVKEAGIYTMAIETYFHCIVRDVLAAEIDVPDKCSLSVIYTLRTTV